MEISFTGEGGANLIFIGTMCGIVATGVYFYTSHKRGIEVTKIQFQTKALLCFGLIFVVFPFCLTDLSPFNKIIGSSFALVGSFLSFFGIHRIKKIIMKTKRTPDKSP